MQAQQTVIFDRIDALYERKIETILWANLKVGWMKQKARQTSLSRTTPSTGSHMTTAKAYHVHRFLEGGRDRGVLHRPAAFPFSDGTP